MTRRLAVGLAIFLAAVGYLAFRPGKAARAEEKVSSPALASAEYASDDETADAEDRAAARWRTGQARHWRQLMIQR